MAMTRRSETTNPLAGLEALAKSDRSRREAERAANRAAMPLCTAAIDEARRVFGDRDMKVIWMSENGKEVGKRKPAGDWEMGADAYIALDQHYKHLVWRKK